MGVKGTEVVQRFLKKHSRIGIDTNVFIYWIESHPSYKELVRPVFLSLDRSQVAAVTSSITMLEVLVKPYKESRLDLVYEFFSLLSNYPALQFMDVTLAIAHEAAKIRADANLRTPDAIQAATAIAFGASGFIGNDPAFKKVSGLDVLILKDWFR